MANLNVATAALSTTTSGLESATTTINVSSATAPTTGQVLTATSSTTATWQAGGGGGGGTGPLSQDMPVTLRNGDELELVPGDVWFQAPPGRVVICPIGGTPLQSFFILNRRNTNVGNQDVYFNDRTLMVQVPGGESFILICLTSGGGAGSWEISKVFNPP